MILSASGGLVYHARAAFTQIESLVSLSGEDRWAPTRRYVSNLIREWLEEIEPGRLIVFGPSAGYLLERDLFARLNRPPNRPLLQIVAVDPDPLAAILFRRRFRSSRVDWHSRDDLLPFSSSKPEAFKDFVTNVAQNTRDSTPTAILFLGLLGQIALHRERATRSVLEARRRLLFDLKEFHWASLHDLESARLARRLPGLPPLLLPEAFNGSSLEDLRQNQSKRLSFITDRLESARACPKTWTDHETEWLGTPDALVPWLLAPHQFHDLGFIRRRLSSPPKL